VTNDREILHGRPVVRDSAVRDNVVYEPNGRTLSAVVNDLKIEGKAFLNTRIEMLKTEMNEKVGAIKSSIPMLVVGLVFGLTAWLVITAAIVCIIAAAFGPGVMSWVYATAIVGVAYLLIAGIAGSFAYSEIKRANLKPDRTLRVLKADQAWLQNESSATATEIKNDISIRRAA